MRPQNIDRNGLTAEGADVSSGVGCTRVQLGSLNRGGRGLYWTGSVVVSLSGMRLTACVLGNGIRDNEVVTAMLAHAAHDEGPGPGLGLAIVVDAMALRADNDQFVDRAW